jgi:transmembrane sensor
MSRYERLGRRIADLQDRKLASMTGAAAEMSPALGEHLLRTADDRRRRQRRRVALSGALALVLAGGALAALTLRPKRGVEAVVTVRAEAGQRVAASLLDLSLVFDDGSQVVLSSGASVRTEMIGPASATVELERGRAQVRVVHGKATRFTVRAGKYTIAVTGTRFSVDWRPEKAAFLLAVQEGSVRVSGGLLTDPVDIGSGQSIALEQNRAAGEPAPAAKPAEPTLPAPAPVLDPPPGEAPAVVASIEPSASARRSPAHSTASPRWRQQAEAGRYREAFEEAEQRGFEDICRQASGAELLTLAEAARYAGRPDRAGQALKAVRARFSRGEDAAMAAYVLGRIAAESRRDHAEAAHWFRTYLAERPGGRLNREAEGRLLESLAFMDRRTAEEAARAYLEHYPSGPHAAFARNLLGP